MSALENVFNGIDIFGETVVKAIRKPLDWLKVPEDAIKKNGQRLDNSPPPPSPFDKLKGTTKAIKELVVDYHRGMNVHVHEWSQGTQTGIHTLIMKVLTPLSIVKTGDALRKIFADNVARLAFFISFSALYILCHSFPYISLAALTAGAIYLYNTVPVALITFLAGSVLLVQLFLTYQVAQGVERGIDLIQKESDDLKKKADELSGKFDILKTIGANKLSVTAIAATIFIWSKYF